MINSTIERVQTTAEKVQTSAKEVQIDAREVTQRALYLQLGVAGLAYDAVKNALGNSQSFFDRAINRGERIETTARKEIDKYVNRAEERMDVLQTRVKGIVKRAESAVEENIEVTSNAVNGARSRVETAVKKAAPQLEKPFANYDSLTAKEVVAKLNGMSNEQLRDIKMYEVANQNRVTIVREVDRKLTALPIANYDNMTVAELEPVLKTLSAEELKTVRAYETDHENRVTLLDEIYTQLQAR